MLKECNIIKKNWKNVSIKFALCYPNLYRIGMSCLAIHLIYELLNMYEDIVCERFFLDENIPLKSLESNMPLNAFDVAGFSLQYELDYINFIRVLLKSGIPPISIDRDDSHPIICLGGPAITANPEPLALFADVIILGEFEPIVDSFLNVLLEYKDKSKLEILERLSKIPGIYVPSINETAERIWVHDLNSAYHAIKQVIPTDNFKQSFSPILGRSFLLEISRGCTFGCRFCLEGYNYLPMRFRSLETLQSILENGLKYTPTNKVVIIGSAASMHPNLEEIFEFLHSNKCTFSVSSLRLDLINEKLLKLLARSGQKTITFAPEAASDRLLDMINKGFRVHDILKVIKLARSFGFKRIKLYFMIGLPGETMDDIKSIVELSNKIIDIGFKSPKSIKISFSFFVPKANTPFQWFGMDSHESLEEKVQLIKEKLCGKGSFEIVFHSMRESFIQAFLSRSDRYVAPILLKLAEGNNSISTWRKVEKKFNFSIESYATKTLNPNLSLPWGNIKLGYERSLILNEYNKAIKHIS